MKARNVIAFVVLLCLVVFTGASAPTTSENYRQPAGFIAAGGGPLAVANYRMPVSIVGQPIAGISAGGDFRSLLGAIPHSGMTPSASWTGWRIY